MAQLMPLRLTVSCFSKIQIGFAFLVPTDPSSPGKRAIKQVCLVLLIFKLFACVQDRCKDHDSCMLRSVGVMMETIAIVTLILRLQLLVNSIH